MALAGASILGPPPAPPSTPWLGLRQALRQLMSFLEETPHCAATPLRALAAADLFPSLRFGLRREPRGSRRCMVSPTRSPATCPIPSSAPRLPQAVWNLTAKICQKLSLASPNPSGVRAGERQFPPSPPGTHRVRETMWAPRLETNDACSPTTSGERSVGAVEPHARERYRQALPAHGTPRMSQDQSRPNVLLIITDQQRGDCLGIDGHPVLQTPAMDWLGASGTFFRRGYSESPSCIPARRVLMSGRPPDEDGMVGFMSAPWDPPATLAGELRAAGYETRMVGKLHLHPKRHRFGFDVMELADSTRADDNEYLDWLQGEFPLDRWAMAHGATPNGWIGRPNHLPEEKTHTFWCVSRAIEYLEKRDPSCPFFLNVSFIDPHPPMTPPDWFYDRYAAMDLPEPAMGDWMEPWDGPPRGIPAEKGPYGQRGPIDPDAMHHLRAAYYGMINHIDMQMSRLFQYMRDNGLLEETFIVFVSDHGEMLGDHQMYSKCRALDASARVPFLARAPQRMGLPREVVRDQPVGLQDVMPTILEAVGAPIPESVSGRSLLPLMRGEDADWRRYLHGEHAGMYRYVDGNHWLVDQRYKYIWMSQTGREFVFDLHEDPLEERDLSAQADLQPWREHLIEVLRDRPEGFTDGQRLIPGQTHEHMVPTKVPAGITVTRPKL